MLRFSSTRQIFIMNSSMSTNKWDKKALKSDEQQDWLKNIINKKTNLAKWIGKASKNEKQRTSKANHTMLTKSILVWNILFFLQEFLCKGGNDAAKVWSWMNMVLKEMLTNKWQWILSCFKICRISIKTHTGKILL